MSSRVIIIFRVIIVFFFIATDLLSVGIISLLINSALGNFQHFDLNLFYVRFPASGTGGWEMNAVESSPYRSCMMFTYTSFIASRLPWLTQAKGTFLLILQLWLSPCLQFQLHSDIMTCCPSGSYRLLYILP
jgi:hypothetical protein